MNPGQGTKRAWQKAASEKVVLFLLAYCTCLSRAPPWCCALEEPVIVLTTQLCKLGTGGDSCGIITVVYHGSIVSAAGWKGARSAEGMSKWADRDEVKAGAARSPADAVEVQSVSKCNLTAQQRAWSPLLPPLHSASATLPDFPT